MGPGSERSPQPAGMEGQGISALAKSVHQSALWMIPVHATLGLAVLTLFAQTSIRTLREAGTWIVIGAWGLTIVYAVMGSVGGPMVAPWE